MQISPILPKVLSSEPIWADLFKVVDEVLNTPTESRINKLAQRHNIDALLDTVRGRPVPIDLVEDSDTRALITNIAEVLGYAYRDSGKLNTIEYYRFVEESTRFIHDKGTEQYLNFFSFMAGVLFEVTPLWYRPETKELLPESSAVIEGDRFGLDDTVEPKAFPMPYVELHSNSEWTSRFTLKEQTDLFYSIAPMNVVLRDLVTAIDIPTGEGQLVYAVYLADHNERTPLVEA